MPKAFAIWVLRPPAAARASNSATFVLSSNFCEHNYFSLPTKNQSSFEFSYRTKH
jgi:hypothetical protein